MEQDYLEMQLGTHQIAYLDPNPSGSPLVLLIHGLGADGSSWTYQLAPMVSSGMRPIAPDLPGFGRSKKLGGRWKVREAAEILKEFIDILQISRIFVAGLSMGGVVAQEFTLRFSEMVQGLILLDTFSNLMPKRKSETIYLLNRFITAQVKGVAYQADMVAQRLFPGEDKTELRDELRKRILQSDAGVYRQAMIELGLYNSLPRLKQITTPTLVISGQNDTTVPMANQDDLANGIRNAKRILIPNAGHAVIIDQPLLVNQAMIEFIQENL